MKPSDINSQYPFDSVLKKSEAEDVALNIIKILSRTGDEWRSLTWEEYVIEREKDGKLTSGEKHFFDKVICYTNYPESACLFSPSWELIYQNGNFAKTPAKIDKKYTFEELKEIATQFKKDTDSFSSSNFKKKYGSITTIEEMEEIWWFEFKEKIYTKTL